MFLSGVEFGVRHLSSWTWLSACTPDPSPGRELPGELEGRRARGLLVASLPQDCQAARPCPVGPAPQFQEPTGRSAGREEGVGRTELPERRDPCLPPP